MTPGIWLLAATIGAALFGLGGLTSWVLIRRREYDGAQRANVILGVLFTVVALTVVADTVQLHVRFQGEVDCNTKVLHNIATTTASRRDVDTAAAKYDGAFEAWLNQPTEDTRRALLAALAEVEQSRIGMIGVYDNTPLPACRGDPAAYKKTPPN